MRILGIKPGHDGTIAFLEDRQLIYSIEGEKNSFARFYPVTPSSFLDAAQNNPEIPDCIALSGWRHGDSKKRIG